MSSEVRTLLRRAVDPVGEPDISAAWVSGRRRLARRRFVGALGVASLVAVVSIGGAALHTTSDGRPSTTAASNGAPACGTPLSRAGDAPNWTRSANPPTDVPHVLSRQRNVAAFVFGQPLQAHRSDGRTNKILWVVREPRNGRPLRIAGRRARTRARIAPIVLPAGSEPGEIYPSTVNVPRPGCWVFTLSWGPHRATIGLVYR
jgi:hypothetical protein